MILISTFWASFIGIYAFLGLHGYRATLLPLVQIGGKYTLVQIGLRLVQNLKNVQFLVKQ